MSGPGNANVGLAGGAGVVSTVLSVTFGEVACGTESVQDRGDRGASIILMRTRCGKRRTFLP